jgi:hypothetical protein
MAKKKKKYQPKLTAEEYEELTGQRLGNLKEQSSAVVNGVTRPVTG